MQLFMFDPHTPNENAERRPSYLLVSPQGSLVLIRPSCGVRDVTVESH